MKLNEIKLYNEQNEFNKDQYGVIIYKDIKNINKNNNEYIIERIQNLSLKFHDEKIINLNHITNFNYNTDGIITFDVCLMNVDLFNIYSKQNIIDELLVQALCIDVKDPTVLYPLTTTFNNLTIKNIISSFNVDSIMCVTLESLEND